MSSINVWNPNSYDEKFNYVSQFGKGVVELLNPQKGEKILDLGSGTGDLSSEISKTGAIVTGMDVSNEMLSKAREKYPAIPFLYGDAASFKTNERFDAVFSNAVLHWMKNAENVVQSIEKALKSGGRFVAEFGGKGNIQTAIRGIGEVLQEYGVNVVTRNPWYFPSIGEYSTLLEENGLEVAFAHPFERPTQLPDGDQGFNHFLNTFAKDFFQDFSEDEKAVIYEKIKDKIREDLFKDGVWEMDYKRIRVLAIKK